MEKDEPNEKLLNHFVEAIWTWETKSLQQTGLGKRFSLGSADVVAVPPFNISKDSIMKYLSLDNINLDVPALYVFGDNFVDAGNNNYLHIPDIQSNYSPYGIDFGGKPTGRYTNGRTVADFIAQFTGLPFPPPVLSLSKEDKIVPQTGLNYASGYTGINGIYGNLFTLYQLGARKIVVNNAFPIGCQPHLNLGGDCYQGGNERALFFNPMMYNFTKDLSSRLPGLQLVLVDLYKIFEDVFKSPASYGFTQVKSPCCSKIDAGITARCIANAELCKDRSKYVFFDAINPTESMHFIWAKRLLKDSTISYPINLIQLIQS
ncbi:hypothetical protein GQ457_09G024100 [Hibiscus cannabinus]